jgi:multicomponent Na+:H+ antiporter subunit D
MERYAPLLVAGPFAAAVLITAIQRYVPRSLVDAIAILTALAVCIGAVLAARAAVDGPLVVWIGGWTPRPDGVIGIGLVIDVLGGGFAALIAAIVCASVVFARVYFRRLHSLFQVLMMVFLGAGVGLATTGDLFNFYVFFELVGVAAFVLAAYRIEHNALHGAFVFAITNSIAGLLVLLGISVLYAIAGTLNLAELGRALPEHAGEPALRLAFALIACGFLMKAAAVPFQFWVSDAYAGAASPVSVLFGGASVTIGVFGLARVYWTVFSGETLPPDLLRNLLIPLGLLTAATGALLALAETDLKRVLALTTVSHVGVLLVAVALQSPLGLEGGTLYLVGHAFAKSGLFVCAGILVIAGEAHRSHVVARAIALLLLAYGGLAIAGLPPGGMYLGKELVFEASEAAGLSVAASMLTLTSIVSGAALISVTWRTYRAGYAQPQFSPANGWVSLLAIAFLAFVLIGANNMLLVAEPQEMLHAGALRFIDREAYASAVIEGVRTPLASPLDPGSTATGPASFIAPAAAIILVLLAIGAKRLRETRLGGLLAFAASARRIHTGDVRDYVAWAMLGIGAIGATVAAA